ncbi:MAG: J domain-containing protein [Desulfovibrionaceae bacterium]|nr:J domain-containing protein [Desulfovibrionaceae bacterium]MBF0513213.1 J domain-containing protein [Desulfovibrionaceae bacterium]
MEYKDYYKILGVSKAASQEDISKAFKKKARACHPDLNPGDSCAEANFKDLNEANEVLKDPEKRKLYDSLGPNWQAGQNFQPPPGFDNVRFHFGGQGPGGGGQQFDASAFSDFFETLFGGAQPGFGRGGGGFSRRPARGDDAQAILELTLEEAYRGGGKALSLQEQGIGPDGRPTMNTKTLQVNIPAGVRDGSKIRLSGQGNPGHSGGSPGDLYLHVRILPHAVFKLEDNNVTMELALAPWEAVLGVAVSVPTLDGQVELRIPPGTGSGKKFRLRGKGLGGAAHRGDQFVRVMIQVPAGVSGEEKTLWEKLRDVSTFAPRSVSGGGSHE